MVRESLGAQLQTTSPLATVAASGIPPLAGSVPSQGPSFNGPAATVLTSNMIQQPSKAITGLPSLSPQIPTEPSMEV